MSPRGVHGAAPLRRFFLSEPPAGERARLAAEDERHALRVLRVARGDELLGLDGAGRAWPLVVVETGRNLELRVAGEPAREPAPGSPDSPLVALELAVSLPRAGRAETMVDRLVQLGVAALTPLVCERSGEHARAAGARSARLLRVAREACKQSGRLWLPRIEPPAALAELLDARAANALVLASAEAPEPLAGWTWPRGQPCTVLVGPEGGFAPAELESARSAGVAERRLSAYVLRTETAAEAAAALLLLGRPS